MTLETLDRILDYFAEQYEEILGTEPEAVIGKVAELAGLDAELDRPACERLVEFGFYRATCMARRPAESAAVRMACRERLRSGGQGPPSSPPDRGARRSRVAS